VSDTVALLMADRAFVPGSANALAKIAILIGSTVAAVLGSVILVSGRQAVARSPASDMGDGRGAAS
jgi:Na+/H+ antiporter NhaA